MGGRPAGGPRQPVSAGGAPPALRRLRPRAAAALLAAAAAAARGGRVDGAIPSRLVSPSGEAFKEAQEKGDDVRDVQDDSIV